MQDDKEFVISAEEAENKKTQKTSFFKTRSFKYGSLATALTAVVIIVVIAANLIFSILSDKYSWSFDLTSTDLYAVSDASKQIVNSLDEDALIKITVFSAENNYPHYLAEPVKRFCNLSENISCTYVDLEKNPTAATQYGSEYSITTYSVAVECGDKVRIFSAEDYYSYDSESGAVSIYIEEKLASGVLYVTKEDIPVVYFIDGHGEEGYDAFMNLVANNGADVEKVSLSSGVEFSPYSKLMVICNPVRDFSDTEIRMIEDFLNNGNKFGRNLMYFSSAETYDLPNIEKFIETWGIRFNDDIVYDDENCYLQYPNMVIPEFTKSEIMSTGATVSAVTSPLLTDTRSLELIFEESDIYKTQKLITSNATTSYARPASTISNEVGRQDGDKGGPHCLSALAMKYKFENNVQIQSYMFVSGSADMLDASHLSYSADGEFLMQLYKIMVNEQDDTIVDAQKAKSSTVATITSPQMSVVAIITLAAIPLIFLILGLAIYIRRRFL